VNPHGRPFRRTVLIVVALHVGLLLFVGLPFASCHKPPTIQPVEIIDLGSLRPGPGLPSPTPSSAQNSPTQPASEIQNPKSKISVPPEPAPAEEPEPTPTPPTPEPKPEPKPSPKPEPIPLPVTKTAPIPQPETPAKHQVKVSTTKKKVSVSSSSPSETKTSSPKFTTPAGPTASDIKNRLASKLPTEQGGGGGDGTGNAGRPDGVADDFSWYRALIKQSIQSAWKKPPIPAGEKIYTEVEIKIAFDGSVTFIKLSRPSGDPAMDASVEQAVRSTPRLPKPLPPGLGSPDYIVIIQFKLE
jgi:TonB family protein